MRQLCLASAVLLMIATSPLASAPPKPGTHPPVPLIVTVHDEFSTGVPCGLCGDGIVTSASGTDYVDGEAGVKAAIDQYGNLIIDFQTSKTQERGLLFRDAGGSTFSTGTNQYMATTTRAIDPPFVPFQAMSVGQTQRVRACPTYDDETNQRRYVHAFQRDCFVSDSAGDATSFLVVTRTSTTGWTVASEASAAHMATVFHVPTKGRIQNVTYEDRSLPFRMTLVAKP
jgi:hypothetical protein